MSCRIHDGDVVAIERTVALADQRASRLLTTIGHEIHGARVSRGLSQSAVAAVAWVDQAEVSRIERGMRAGVTIRSLARLAATVGLELSIKLYPAGQPLRDRAHIDLLERFRAAVGARWAWSAEVPLPIPGDKASVGPRPARRGDRDWRRGRDATNGHAAAGSPAGTQEA